MLVQSLGAHGDDDEDTGYSSSTKSMLSRTLAISVSLSQLQKTYNFLLAEASLNTEFNGPKYFREYNAAAKM